MLQFNNRLKKLVLTSNYPKYIYIYIICISRIKLKRNTWKRERRKRKSIKDPSTRLNVPRKEIPTMGYSIVDRANESSVIKPSYARVREQWVTLVLRWTAISTPPPPAFKSWYTLRVIFAQLPSNNRGRKASIIKTSYITPISAVFHSVAERPRCNGFVKPRNECAG